MTEYLTPIELRKRKELAKVKSKKPVYLTTWQLTEAIFLKYLEIDENPRYAPMLKTQLKALEKELDARDK